MIFLKIIIYDLFKDYSLRFRGIANLSVYCDLCCVYSSFCFSWKFFFSKTFLKIEIPSGLGDTTVSLENFACALEGSVPGGDLLSHLFGLAGAVFLVPHCSSTKAWPHLMRIQVSSSFCLLKLKPSVLISGSSNIPIPET